MQFVADDGGKSPKGTSSTATMPQRRQLTRRMVFKAPFGELVVTGDRQMAAEADCGRTLARSHGHFDTLLVGTEMALKRTAANLYHKPLQTREPRD